MDTISKIEFQTMEKTTGNLIINGVPVNQKVRIEVGCCGNCKNVLVQFQPNEHIMSRIDYIQNNLINNLKYCPNCGAKIDYSGCEIINGECTEINN